MVLKEAPYSLLATFFTMCLPLWPVAQLRLAIENSSCYKPYKRLTLCSGVLIVCFTLDSVSQNHASEKGLADSVAPVLASK